jgi:hypothetical protein
VARSIYVPLSSEELDLLVAMGKQEKRGAHDQAAHLISVAVYRWRAERELEASLRGESTEMEESVA